MSCTPDGDEIADPTMIQVGDIRYLRRAGGLPPLRPVLGIAHAQDPAFGFQSEPSTGLRQDPDTGTVYWRRNGVDLYSMDDGGSGGDVAVTSITPVASDRLLGRDTAGSGACEELTVGGGLEFTGSGGIQRSALTGDVTASAGSGSLTIASDAVTYAKMQNVSATDRLLGRSTAGAGDVEEIPCTAAGRALLDDADAAAQRTTLGLAIGTDVQAYDAGLASLAALPTVADRLAYSTAADTWAETALTTFGRSLIDDADASAARTTLGLGTAAVEAASAFAAASHTHAASDIVSGQLALARGGTAADLSATGGTSQFLRQSSAGAAITVGVIGHADLGPGGGSGSKYLRDDMTWQTVSAGVTDHGALTGLGDDDHAQYALLLGRSGGQTLIGGTASGDDLTLQSTAHATRGNIFFGSGGLNTFDDVNSRWGFGVAAPARTLEVRSTSAQIRGSYSGAIYYELECKSSGTLGITTTAGASNATMTIARSGSASTLRIDVAATSVGVIPAGTQIYSTTEPLSLCGSLTAGESVGIYYYDTTAAAWRVALDIPSVAGFGSLALMPAGGKVGIGTTSAARALEVRSTSAQIRASYSGSVYGEWAVDSTGTNTFSCSASPGNWVFGGGLEIYDLTATSGERRAGGMIRGTGTYDNLILGSQTSGTSGVQIVYNNGSQFYSALEIDNVGSGRGEMRLMKSGGVVGIGTGSGAPATLLELEQLKLLTFGVSDGYSAALTLDPGYTGAFTVDRHNYIDVQNPSTAASAVVTDAALVRFDAAAGTHKAVDSGTTKTTPGTVDAWVKVNINGTLYYLPAYTSKTT